MPLTPSGSSPALLISIALHVVAVVGAGLQRHHAPSARLTIPLEISIESEAPPPPPSVPTPEPLSNVAPAAPPRVAAAHHEPVAVRAVAATEPKATAEAAPPVAALPALASDAELPHFAIATSIAAGPVANLAKGSGTAGVFQGVPEEAAPYAEDAVDVPARATRKIAPRYPLEARSSGTEATVRMEIVLSASGIVESVRALNHPGHGFEEEAIAAARRTPFAPAMKRGRAVPVRMAWTVEFRLQ